MNKKFILFMTSLSLAVTPIGVFASEYSGPTASIEAVEERANLQAATGEYRSWKQYDTRWSSMNLGSSRDTMAESGCLVVSIATLMVHSGCADENGVDPGKLCTYLSNNGGFTSNGELYWAKVNGAVDGFSLANWSVALSGSRYDKVAQIKSYLDSGYYLVVSVGYGAHWVAVNSVDGDGNVNIFDPAYSYTKLFGNYSDAGVTRMAVFAGNGGGNGNIDVPSNGNNSSMENYNATGKVNVGASYLNVRLGAGTDQGYLTDSVGNRITLQNNETVTITGKGYDGSGNLWYRVAINGLTGYVYGAYIDITNNSNNNTSTPSEEKAAKVNASYVNVRSGAGTNNSVVATLALNTSLTVVGEEKDGSGATWYKINYAGGSGYMHSDYITVNGDNNNNNNNSGYEKKDGTVNANSVNVRGGAGTGNSIVGNLSSGAAVTIVGEKKDSSGVVWYKIEYDGGSGYMHSDYITVGSGNGGNSNGSGSGNYPMEGIEGKEGVINAALVNVRSGANSDAEVMNTLKSGVSVLIESAEQDASGIIWYKVAFAGTSGYVMAEFVSVQ